MTNDNLMTPGKQPNLPPEVEFSLGDVTVLYTDIANRVAEYTRMNTQELAKIIARIHQANQAA